MDKSNWLLVIMVFLPLAGAIGMVCLGAGRPQKIREWSLVTTLLTLLLAIMAVVMYEPRPIRLVKDGPIQPDPKLEFKTTWLPMQLASSGSSMPAVQFHLGVDGPALWLVALTALLMVSAVLVSWEAITERFVEYYALLLLLECGMLGVFCALDIILFYVFFEFTLLPLFFLIGIWGGPEKRLASRKFFLYTLAGSMISLVGLVALVLTISSQGPGLTFSIPELARRIAEGTPKEYLDSIVIPLVGPVKMQTLLFLALFAGFAIKVPLFPFHTWLPLAHVEAPTAGSVLLAGVLLKLGTFGFLRLCLPLLPGASVEIGMPLITSLATIGIIYGALCALAQEDIKKLVAYSSVSHLGFCMLGLFALNAEGISGSIFEMVNHGLSTGALFLLVGMLYERYHTRQLGEYGGMAARLPIYSFFLVFISLSSLGLPGLNGFVGEYFSLIGIFNVPSYRIYAVIGTFGVILSAWYLLVMVQSVCFGPLKEPGHGDHPVHDLKLRELAALVPIAAACLWIGLYPKPMMDRIRPDVNALVKMAERSAPQAPAEESP
jgi:NADH-quinone oxidoreductase subunit M